MTVRPSVRSPGSALAPGPAVPPAVPALPLGDGCPRWHLGARRRQESCVAFSPREPRALGKGSYPGLEQDLLPAENGFITPAAAFQEPSAASLLGQGATRTKQMTLGAVLPP